jgi:hypothetical protein
MLGLSPWVAVLVIVVAAALARALPGRLSARIERTLNGRAVVVCVGVASGLLALWLWGTLRRSPVIHDESAYLLQAELFARFRWTGAAPPIPEFFEQLHVLVNGVLASKYPPGNSLVLALGVLAGLPGLPVIVMNACASALMFVLARRAAGGAVALLTVIAWTSSFPMIYYHASYMSESVTSLAWLLTWWGIARWRAGEGRMWLTLAAAAVAWCMITRPVTGLALGITALGVVLWCCRRSRRWRDLVPSLGAGAAILSVVLLWNWRTMGDVRVMPLTFYTRTYVPFDKPGFGSTPSERPSARLPRDQERMQEVYYRDHLRHTWRALPATIWTRLKMIDRDMWYEWRGGLRIFALIGLGAMGVDSWIVLAAFALQFIFYLSYAHPPFWTLYYLEGTPMLAFLIALGIGRVLAALGTMELTTLQDSSGAPSRFRQLAEKIRTAVLTPIRPARGGVMASGTMALAAVGLVAVFAVARQVKTTLREDHAYYDSFANLVTQIPDRRAIVFVRYSDKHLDGLSLVRNVPDLTEARVWTVYDRGTDNARLLALAPQRAPYLFDEASWTLRRFDTAASQSAVSQR